MLSVGLVACQQPANAIDEVQIPAPQMPSPNAYDFYIKAIAAYVPANPPVDAILDSKEIPEAQWKTVYPTAKKEAWLRQNAKTLDLLRQGFQYSSRVPPARDYAAIAERLPVYSKFREMARLLTIESHARSERGNWSGAADSALDTLRLGRDLAQGGTLMDFLVSAAINSIGIKESWKILPHLNATESKAAAQRLEKIIELRSSYADILREETHFGKATFSQFAEEMRADELQSENAKGEKDPKAKNKNQQLPKTPRSVSVEDYTQFMDAIIADAEKPYNAKTAATVVEGNPYDKLLGQLYKNGRWNYARNESANALLLVSLALRAYNLEYKIYPQNLQELAPNYLQKIPADPFGDGEELRYRRAGREYSLYSIGPDGVDNRGRTIEDLSIPMSEKRRRFLVQPESKGDMVAGVN